MSCSKPLPPFICDSLYYLNRNQLERFSIVSRPLKKFIERYLHMKPYRVFDELRIRRATYALSHNNVQWHPNRDDYSAQQFLAGEALHSCVKYYSFAEMRPYLAQTVRIKKTFIFLIQGFMYYTEHIEQMQSLAHLWCDRKIFFVIFGTHFSFKDYKVLYNAKIIEIDYKGNENDPEYWPKFLEQPEIKPLVVLRELHPKCINTVLDHLSKVFSSAVSPNAFKIVFAENDEPLTEFRESNKISGEKLELKRRLPTDYQNKYLDRYFNYTLERSSI